MCYAHSPDRSPQLSPARERISNAPTAAQAWQQTQVAEKKKSGIKVKKQLVAIDADINNAISEGEYFITWPDYLYEETRNNLLSRGFKLYATSNPGQVQILWSKT